MIDRLVRTFYGRARLDPLIEPVLVEKAHDREAHFDRRLEIFLPRRRSASPMEAATRIAASCCCKASVSMTSTRSPIDGVHSHGKRHRGRQ
ncbi:MAG: hypothetical protein ACREFB_05555 [Stellaceae bacterium]